MGVASMRFLLPKVSAFLFCSSTCPKAWACQSQIRNLITTNSANMFSIVERGTVNTDDYRVFFKNTETGNVISPFHDIPLKNGDNFNMVVEIPRWSNAKMEIATKEVLNPIKQDVKNFFPHHGYIWNYGALPQTWEDPAHVDENTSVAGDNDPLDVVEIGGKIHPRGAVIQVKILGVLAMIDDGETDWRVFCIDVNDEDASKLNDISDVKTHKPGLVEATVEWFKYYKVPDGKPVNEFAFNNEAKDKAFAVSVIQQTHEQWLKLMKSPENEGKIDITNVCNPDTPKLVSADDAAKIMEEKSKAFSKDGPQIDFDPKNYFVADMVNKKA